MSRTYKIQVAFIIALFLLACKSRQTGVDIKIEKVFITDAVSSGSGLGFIDNTLFIVGDDAEYIANMPVNTAQYTRLPLYADAPIRRIDRAVKHDLESCALGLIGGETFLCGFGSGGKSPYRDTLFAVNSNDAKKSFKRSLLPLYNAIRSKTALKENELNIEGAATAGDKLLLFNRGKNFIIILKWKQFAQYIQQAGAVDLPPFTILNVTLPVINNFQIGFSGACALNESELLFTASLEETNDFTEDGAIKGSYIGILKLVSETAVKLVTLQQLKNKDGSVIKDKLEAIEVIKITGNDIRSVAVADNDDGTSKIFYLHLKTK